jgi:hypothetical protein
MANKYWLGSTSSTGSSWNVAGNWSGSGVPATGDTIYLNNTYTTRSLTIDVSPTIGALYTTGYTSSITLSSSITLAISGPPGDMILDPSMSWIANNPGSNILTYNNGTSNTGSVNFNGVTWSGSFRPNIGFQLTGSMNIAYDYTIAMANSTTVFIQGQTGSVIYCNRNVTNGGSTLYTFLNNVDFMMTGTGSHTIGNATAANNNFNCKNFYISSSNGNGNFTIYGINIIPGYGQASTFTGSFEYTNGSGLRLAGIAGVNGQLVFICNAGQMVNVQVNNKTNPSDRIQFDPGSVIALGLSNTSGQTFTIMSDIVINNNGVIQLGNGSTVTETFYSYSGSRFVFKEGQLIGISGGGSNYNGTVTCSFEGPTFFQAFTGNATWRLPIIIDSGYNTCTFNTTAGFVINMEYRSGKINIPTDRYLFLNASTIINAHKAGQAGLNHFLMQTGGTTTMNEFPSGTPSKPVLIRSTTPGSVSTINLINGLDPTYMPISSSYKIARNVIASSINVTGKPVYIYGKIAPQLLKPSLISSPPSGTAYPVVARSTNTGIRYINESSLGWSVGNANNIVTNLGGTLTRNIGAMAYGWGFNAQATDPTRV